MERGKAWLLYPCREGWCCVRTTTCRQDVEEQYAYDDLPSALKAIARLEGCPELRTARTERGVKGGIAAAIALTPEERTERARKAANQRWRSKDALDGIVERDALP